MSGLIASLLANLSSREKLRGLLSSAESNLGGLVSDPVSHMQAALAEALPTPAEAAQAAKDPANVDINSPYGQKMMGLAGLLGSIKVGKGNSGVADLFSSTPLEKQMVGVKKLEPGTKVLYERWGHTYTGTVVGNKYIKPNSPEGEGWFAPRIRIEGSYSVDQAPFGVAGDPLTDTVPRLIGKEVNSDPFSIKKVFTGPEG